MELDHGITEMVHQKMNVVWITFQICPIVVLPVNIKNPVLRTPGSGGFINKLTYIVHEPLLKNN
jgi:hypothetical protein